MSPATPIAEPEQTTVSDHGRPVAQAAQRIGVSVGTIHRWRLRGLLDPSGHRRRPTMTRVGGRWHIRDRDLETFFAALAGAEADPQTPAAQSRSAERAVRELDQIGM